MPDTKKTSPAENWTSVQAYALAVICLLVGVAAGWLFRVTIPIRRYLGSE